jgi:hypothetical protein
VENVERKLVAPNHVATFYIQRLYLLLCAEGKCDRVCDEGKRSAFAAEAKGVIKRVTRSLRGLRSQDWDDLVRSSTPHSTFYGLPCVADVTLCS